MSTIHAPGPLARLRTDFPILGRQVNGKRLVYLDSAATAQKPRAVLDALDEYYEQHNANVHRGVYTLAEDATAAYEAAHAAGALVLVDAAQAVPHLTIDVAALGADFLAFSGHKMLGPTGIGALWARRELLEAMPPFLGGGEMISDVRLDGFTCAELPWKFEAGTPPIAEAVGLGAAIDYLDDVGMKAVRAHELSLTAYAVATMQERFGDRFRVHGPAEPAERSGVLSFEFATSQGDSVHPHDIAQVLDSEG